MQAHTPERHNGFAGSASNGPIDLLWSLAECGSETLFQLLLLSGWCSCGMSCDVKEWNCKNGLGIYRVSSYTQSLKPQFLYSLVMPNQIRMKLDMFYMHIQEAVV